MVGTLITVLLLLCGSVTTTVGFSVTPTKRRIIGGNRPIKPSLQFIFQYCDWPAPSNLTEIQPTFIVQYRQVARQFTVSNEEQIVYMIDQLYKDQMIKERVAFIIHGFENSISSPWLHDTADAIMAVEDYTIFIAAWGKGADFWLNFAQAAANTQTMATAIAQAAQLLRDTSHPYSYCVGHSLGAHICGQAGMISKFDRITGLDPAGPGFEGCPQHVGLTNSSADCVDVIHTNGEYLNGYGTMAPLGHVDFYPNCGKSQPACSFWDMFVGCSHHSAIEYFIDSINAFAASEKYPSSLGPCHARLIDHCDTCGWWSCPDQQPACDSETSLLQSIGYGSVCHHHKAPACCSTTRVDDDRYFGLWYVPMTRGGQFNVFCPTDK